MLEFIGKDLAGWRVETWYEQRLSIDEYGKYEVAGYFTDKDLASASGKGKAWYGSDGTVAEVLVLTKDGTTGYIIKGDKIILSEQDAIRAGAIEKAKSKLTAEEKKLLGIG